MKKRRFNGLNKLSIPILCILVLCVIVMFLPDDKLSSKKEHVEASTKWVVPGQLISDNMRFGGISAGSTGNHYETYTLSIADHNFEGIPTRSFFMDSHHGMFEMVSLYRTYTFKVEDVDLKGNRIKISATEH